MVCDTRLKYGAHWCHVSYIRPAAIALAACHYGIGSKDVKWLFRRMPQRHTADLSRYGSPKAGMLAVRYYVDRSADGGLINGLTVIHLKRHSRGTERRQCSKPWLSKTVTFHGT